MQEIENGNFSAERKSARLLFDTLINPLINPLSLLYGQDFHFSARSAFARAEMSDWNCKNAVAAI